MIACYCGRTPQIHRHRCMRINPCPQRKLATVTRNSPAYVAAIADPIAYARRIVARIMGARRERNGARQRLGGTAERRSREHSWFGPKGDVRGVGVVCERKSSVRSSRRRYAGETREG